MLFLKWFVGEEAEDTKRRYVFRASDARVRERERRQGERARARLRRASAEKRRHRACVVAKGGVWAHPTRWGGESTKNERKNNTKSEFLFLPMDSVWKWKGKGRGDALEVFTLEARDHALLLRHGAGAGGFRGGRG